MKQPVDHVLRPQLPWRRGDAEITECGYEASKVSTLTRDQFKQRLKDMGQQRTAMLTCMTCSNTASRWCDWTGDPRKAMQREIEWEGTYRNNDRGVRLRDELQAIAALIDAHPDEFASNVESIAQRRAWVEKKAARSPEGRRT